MKQTIIALAFSLMTFLGYAQNNTFTGNSAGQSNTSGSGNTFTGAGAGTANTVGNLNTFTGAFAGFRNTGGVQNVFIGSVCGQFNTTGSNNVFLGNGAGGQNVSGNENTYVGIFAGSQANGSRNVFIGRQAGQNEAGSNRLYIANSATRNPLIYGEFNTAFLRINGNIEITGNITNSAFQNSLSIIDQNRTQITNNTAAITANALALDTALAQLFTFDSRLGDIGTTLESVREEVDSNALSIVDNRRRLNDNRAAILENSTSIAQLNEQVQVDTSQGSVGIGLETLIGARNTFYGLGAGSSNQGDGNVFLGHEAGFDETGSDKLYIANSRTTRPLIFGDFARQQATVNGFLGVGIQNPERPLHLRDSRAIFRIDRDRADPGFAVVRYDQGFQNVWKSFYFYTLGSGVNQGKFIIADWGTDVSGPDHKARLTIDNEGDIGIGPRFENLDNDATAKLHVDGSVRLENLPSGTGQSLVIDAQGQVFRGPAAKVTIEENEKLKSRVEKLEQELAALKQLLGPGHPEEALIPQLYQNNPNPFDQITRIKMFIPENIQSATLYIYDMQGQVLKEMEVKERGETSLEIAGRSLKSGMYLYALIADQQTVATKRMILR